MIRDLDIMLKIGLVIWFLVAVFAAVGLGYTIYLEANGSSLDEQVSSAMDRRIDARIEKFINEAVEVRDVQDNVKYSEQFSFVDESVRFVVLYYEDGTYSIYEHIEE